MKRSPASRTLVKAGIVLISGCALFYAFFAVRSQIEKSRDEQSFQSARRFLAAERPDKAMEIIRNRGRKVSGERSADWLDLEIETLEKSGDIGRLRYLFDQNPSVFSKHETASILIARTMLQTNNRAEYARLRNIWRSSSRMPEVWFAIDVDALIAAGKVNEALTMLNSQTFRGEADAGRLMRLALLTARTDLHGAWNYLDRACYLAPKNPEVRSFRAQILERIGKISMARVEYVAAHLAEPGNPLFRDQLAEYYRRNGNLGLALETWSGNLDESSADFIRLKALFWSRVAYPVKISKARPSDISGDLNPFIVYLQELPGERFWDNAAFLEISDRQTILDKHQEAYWLRVLQALKEGDEKSAYNLLQSQTFRNTNWSPDIQSGLATVLAYRLGYPTPFRDNNILTTGTTTRQRHQLFDQLDEQARTGVVRPELGNLMRSKEAFAAVFMAGGWVEAALQLHTLPVLPDNFPGWVAYGLTESLRFNRGNKAALTFAARQKSSPGMDLLTAELLIADGNTAAGLTKLEALASTDSDIGFRAAWLLVLARLDQHNIKGAHDVLAHQPKLQNSLTGKEIDARIALAEGDAEKANRIYVTLGEESTEAMAYLASKAYREKEWKTARKLTEKLIQKLPDRMELRANLKAIAKAEGAK
jgi:hypothetical protein